MSLLFGFGGTRQNHDLRFADGVSGLQVAAVRQLKIQRIGDDVHGLSACGSDSGLAGMRILVQPGIGHHVEARGLVLVVEVEDEGIGRAMRQVVAAGGEPRASGQDRLLDAVVRSHVDVAARAVDVNHRRTAAFDVNIAFGDHMLHRVVGLKQHA